MYLSKLEIFGFKSFAQKTVFRFDDGLTAIIGPNGCGKSNIVDAIRWVLGEQRPSVLRLDRMDSIIFNGTATRKPLNFTEVSLYIENNKQILPSIYTEVKITRRLYRSGESEYLLNNQPVRLKDIIDLFADTGMGADAYSVIELKMVEQILSDNAEERRRLFEEAAGIKKYKFRRKAALRKLETTQQELVRLNDIISEVQKNVNSLSRQVGKARRYHQYREELRRQEIFLFQLRQKELEQQRLPLQNEYQQVRQTRERLGKEVNVRESELEKLQLRSVDLERQFRTVATRLSEFQEEIRQHQEKVKLDQQRIESLQQYIEKAEKEIVSQRQRRKTLQEELSNLEMEKEKARQAAREKQQQYQEKANLQLEQETHLEALRQKYQHFRQENVTVLQNATQQRDDFQRIHIQKSSLNERIGQLHRQIKNIRQDLQEREAKLAELEKQLADAEEDLNLYRQEQELLRTQIEELEKVQPGLVEKKNRLLGEIEKLRSQRDFLRKVIENYEGFSESVQYVMSHKNQYSGLIDTLANMVDTREEYRPALESFLEEIANYLVVEEVDTARNILKEIRQRKKGRVTVVPLSLLNGSSNGKNNPARLNGEAIPLKEVVEFDPKYQSLFNFLFNRVVLVKDMDTALRYHQQYPEFNYLTLDGELIGEWGNITGGGRGDFNLVGRQRQFEQLDRKLQRAEKELQEVQQKLDENTRQTGEKKAKQQEFSRLLQQQEEQVNRLRQSLGQARFEAEQGKNRQTEVEQEIASLQEQIRTLEEQERQLQPLVESSTRQQQQYREQEQQFNQEIEELERHYRELTREVQQLQVEYLHQQNRVNELEQRQEFVEKEIAEIEERIQTLTKENTHYQEEIQQLQERISEQKQDLDVLYAEHDSIEKEKNELETDYQSLKSVIIAHEDEVKKYHRKWNQALERLRELELALKEIEVKQQSLREQMEEQLGDQLPALLETHPVPEALTVAEVQEEIAKLRRRIEQLGDVNPLAVKEYEQEKERLDFLKSQRDDLLEAEAELLTTINKLNKTASELFLDTFNKINENFKQVFGKFFEGGEAELKLVENSDPLETNIDISVRIKGRRLNTLAVMSAGEKTLTAISLLFSIYLVKPSPFCILDEVDAPLDDVNIGRFTHALKEFSRNTQFILVTHNKMTMQAAQAMYGITMEEPGVSKVVSVRLD